MYLCVVHLWLPVTCALINPFLCVVNVVSVERVCACIGGSSGARRSAA